jgi:hypothetical protein
LLYCCFSSTENNTEKQMKNTMITAVNTLHLQDGNVNPTATTSPRNDSTEFMRERNTDVLDGALLPIATQVQLIDEAAHTSSTINNYNNSMAAVPIQFFDYDEALTQEEQDEMKQQLRQPLLLQQQEQQQKFLIEDEIAYAIPYVVAATGGCQQHFHNPNSIADDSQQAVMNAQYTGWIRVEEEREAVRKANREAYAHNYWEARSVEAANNAAKRRDQEGLQILQDDHLLCSLQDPISKCRKEESSDVQCKLPRPTTPKVGYHIQEYEMTDDYETSQYQVQEYKSIYD